MTAAETEPSDKLVWRVSSSLDTAKPGEVLLLDDQGRVLGPKAMRRATVVGWGVENYGTDPTIEVDNAPQDAASGHDRQLEKAVETAIELVKKAKLVKPAFDKRPQLARGKLPPRPKRGSRS